MAGKTNWSEEQEMAMYRPGQRVELKNHPGTIATVLAYDPMMVPPVILDGHTQPRYPEELILLSPSTTSIDWFVPRSVGRAIASRIAR
jgi:hypothetical protein